MKKQKAKKNNIPHNLVSLFSGIGGFEIAFKDLGVQTTLMCEIEPSAQIVLKAKFPEAKLVNDICELKSLPRNTDIVCAGFPCQDISSIGEKKGMAGQRSSLITEVFRLLRTAKVEWVIIENVSYMIHLNNGETIRTIIKELESLGYKWAYRMLNSYSFLPQHRRRVYVVASLHNNPNDVLLSNSYEYNDLKNYPTEFTEPLGFYWTEGNHCLSLYKNAIPTLKIGSTIGIVSPPAIAFPNGNFAIPDIRDAERLQGFKANWTKEVEKEFKLSNRWKLVGNAVTVDVVKWIAKKIIRPVKYEDCNDKQIIKLKKWPNAAWGYKGSIFESKSTMYPKKTVTHNLEKFLKFSCKPLSYKASLGFKNRLEKGTAHCPDYFREAIANYVLNWEENNE